MSPDKSHGIYCEHCGDSIRSCSTPGNHKHYPELCRHCVVGGASLTDDPSDVLVGEMFFWTVADAQQALRDGQTRAQHRAGGLS